MLLLLKALAGALDLTFGDLLEGIVLHACDGKAPFEVSIERVDAEVRQRAAIASCSTHRRNGRAAFKRPARARRSWRAAARGAARR